MIKSLLILGVMAGNSAFACQLNSAKIEGRIDGAYYDSKIKRCIVTIDIDTVIPHKVCPLFLARGHKAEVAVRLSEKNCPLDEGPVKGTITETGKPGKYRFNGSIDKKRTSS